MIFLAVLLLFGAKRIPEIARSFGKSIREFKKATTDIQEDIRTVIEEEPKNSPTRPASKRVESESAQETEQKKT